MIGILFFKDFCHVLVSPENVSKSLIPIVCYYWFNNDNIVMDHTTESYYIVYHVYDSKRFKTKTGNIHRIYKCIFDIKWSTQVHIRNRKFLFRIININGCAIYFINSPLEISIQIPIIFIVNIVFFPNLLKKKNRNK